MARIRTIKPEFWADEKLGPLGPIHRLVFLGLVSHADDAGRLVDSVRQLDGLIFPHTSDSCEDSLGVLARLSRIRRYTSESGQRLIQIEGWTQHQKVDKPSKYVLPPPPPEIGAVEPFSEVSRESREDLAKDSRPDLGPTTYDLGPTSVERRAREEPPPHESVEGGQELATWLGEGGADVVKCYIAGHEGNADAVHSIVATWTRGTLVGEAVWGSLGLEERRAALASAMLDMAAERKPYNGRTFKAVVLDRADSLRRTREPQREKLWAS